MSLSVFTDATWLSTCLRFKVTRWKKSREDFRYEMQRAVNEIVDELIEKALED